MITAIFIENCRKTIRLSSEGKLVYEIRGEVWVEEDGKVATPLSEFVASFDHDPTLEEIDEKLAEWIAENYPYLELPETEIEVVYRGLE